MAHVKATALKPFNYKGKLYQIGDEVTFEKEAHAARHEKVDLVKLDRETEKKVEAAVEKEKNSKAGPGKK
jgi:nicotinate-nucleotide pyrophosphorylase